jgi:acetylornithine/succinyldiaminopimelate/putrescine aminotransferase
MSKLSRIEARKAETQETEVGFLRSELLTGLTLSKLALDATHSDKADRNRVNAPKAYDTLMRFAPRVSLSKDEAEEIKTKLAALRAALEELGESM